MAAVLYMPKWGSAMTQGKIVFWAKEEDEEVTAGETIVEIETEKINNSVEAPVSGILTKILVDSGESALVGVPIAVITAEGEVWDGEIPAAEKPVDTTEQVESNTNDTEEAFPVSDETLKKPATPAARRLARTRGIDLSELPPTKKNRIVVEDILDYLAQQTGWPGSRFLPFAKGLIHYLDMGQGLPLILLHGLGASCSAWQPNLFFLADHFRVLVPDLPGAGLSDKPATDYSLDFFVNFVGEFLDYLNIDQCVIAGNSLGGEIAAAVTHRFPGRVVGLILEDSAGLGKDVAKELRPTVLNSVNKEGIQELLTLLFHDPQYIYPGTIEEIYNSRQQEGAYAALESAVDNLLSEEGQNAELSDKLREIQLPVLIIWGENDRVIPLSQGIQAAQSLADGKLSVYKDCGHCPHIEASEKFNQEVKSFIEKLKL